MGKKAGAYRPLLNEKQVAERLGVSVAFLRRRRMRNEGPPYKKLGFLCRYTVEGLEQWIASQHGGPVKELHKSSSCPPEENYP